MAKKMAASQTPAMPAPPPFSNRRQDPTITPTGIQIDDLCDSRVWAKSGRLTALGWLIVLVNEHLQGRATPIRASLPSLMLVIRKEYPEAADKKGIMIDRTHDLPF